MSSPGQYTQAFKKATVMEVVEEVMAVLPQKPTVLLLKLGTFRW
jgi:hypothetical protein